MKDKEKQINGNSKYMLFSQRQKLANEYEQWVNTPLKDGSKIKDCALSVITFMQGKGYRKLPEDSVVLSKEEYQEYKKVADGKAIMVENITDLNKLVQFPIEYDNKKFEDISEFANYVQEQAEQNVLANIADGGTSCHWCMEQHEKKASKDTAEKILNDMADLKIVDDKVCAYELVSKLNKLEKQFSVEIKEN